jgi:hypothetical protein
MKIGITVLKIVLVFLLILDLFFWASIYGSGHKIPQQTEITLGIYALLLISGLILVVFAGRKFKK